MQRLQDFLASPLRDGSVRERVTQYRLAWGLFTSSPIVGVGLGHAFVWTRIDGTEISDFTADTPLILPAKLGILGLVWFALLAVVWIRFVLQLRRIAGANIPGLTMAGWAAVLVVLAWAGFLIEDKGFSFTLMFLLALGFIEVERAADRAREISRSRRSATIASLLPNGPRTKFAARHPAMAAQRTPGRLSAAKIRPG